MLRKRSCMIRECRWLDQQQRKPQWVSFMLETQKKEPAATKLPRLAEKPLSVTGSAISISELPDIVNRHFPTDLFWKHPNKHRIGGKNSSDAVLYRRFQNRSTNTNSDDRFS